MVDFEVSKENFIKEVEELIVKNFFLEKKLILSKS